MEAKAQTIVQLFNQLRSQGYALEDLRLIHRAYELAVSLCICQYRSSGRTLLDHSVGAASILAAQDLHPSLVAAAVVHAAYIHGDFGTWRRRIGEDKRARLRAAVGSAAEEIVYGYSLIDRSVQNLPVIRDRVPHLTARERDLVLMRLADLLDIYGEQDALYCANVDKRREVATRWGPGIVAVADALGFPQLAAGLRRGFAEVRDGRPPSALATPAWKDRIIVPRSYRIRPLIAIYQRTRSKIYAVIGR